MTKKPSSSKPQSPWSVGPGFVVAAAFVGPGTVTTATIAGANYGLHLLWVLGFAVVATIIFQEMSSRLGTLTGIGLGELLRRQLKSPWVFAVVAFLITIAIGFGNAAYQTGNLVGAAVGVGVFLEVPSQWILVSAGVLAGLLLAWGSYRVLERVLVGAVATMGLAFVAAAIAACWQGAISFEDLMPSFPSGSVPTVLALLGTTVVPYNLFLHASASSERWSKIRPREVGMRRARVDTVLGVVSGGVVTLAIMVAAAAALRGQAISTAGEAAIALEGILGASLARWLYSLGLAAAGLSSAITAPLATSLAISGLMGWSREKYPWRFRAIWSSVLVIGVGAGVALGKSPAQTILLAQVANAVVLPLVAGVLLWACNAPLLGKYRNRTWVNAVAVAVIATTALLSAGRVHGSLRSFSLALRRLSLHHRSVVAGLRIESGDWLRKHALLPQSSCLPADGSFALKPARGLRGSVGRSCKDIFLHRRACVLVRRSNRGISREARPRQDLRGGHRYRHPQSSRQDHEANAHNHEAGMQRPLRQKR